VLGQGLWEAGAAPWWVPLVIQGVSLFLAYLHGKSRNQAPTAGSPGDPFLDRSTVAAGGINPPPSSNP